MNLFMKKEAAKKASVDLAGFSDLSPELQDQFCARAAVGIYDGDHPANNARRIKQLMDEFGLKEKDRKV